MHKTISIHEAKTNLSKYIQLAKQGEQIFIGAFGAPEVVLQIASPIKRLNIGAWKNKKDFNYKDEDVIGSDAELAGLINKSINEK